MINKIETKLEIACKHIPSYLEATQMLEQYILINGLSEAIFSSYVVSWLI